jgi:hypothetical protein
VSYGSTNASAQCTFTAWSVLGTAGADHVYWRNGGYNPSWFAHNQFGGGGFFTYPGLTAFTNCLWERVSLSGLSQQIYLYNNLFRGGTLNYGILNGGNNALAYDNLFDRTSIINGGPPTYTNVFVSGYNGYVTNYPTLTNSSGHDRVLTNSPLYQTSYLGNYYYPTNDGMLSTLIDAGSRWATNAGLYQFTTTTNQVKEGATMVDIGFHYVAVDSNGNPIDTNGDGIPDYLSDSNGNGSVDSGEIGWNLTGDLGLKVLITRPRNGDVPQP